MSFTPARLQLARQRRGLTKEALAEQIDLTRRALTNLESGASSPSPATLDRLASALGFPVSFFSAAPPEVIPEGGASFRSLSTMTAGQKHAVLAAGAIALELSKWIGDRFNLPQPNVPDMRDMDPEAAAVALRAKWLIGSEKPIANMIHTLEAHGVRVFSLAEDCVEVDGFSVWHHDVPYVFLNTMKSAERSRMDAAHELGHLVLHRHNPPRGRELETEASRFASAFMMPKSAMLVATRRPTVLHLMEVKRTWKASIAAVAYRLHQIGAMTERQYKDTMIEVSKRGWRRSEPDGMPRETSQILDKVLRALREEGVSRTDIANSIHVGIRDLEALIFGLVMTSLRGLTPEWEHRPKTASVPAPALRLVK